MAAPLTVTILALAGCSSSPNGLGNSSGSGIAYVTDNGGFVTTVDLSSGHVGKSIRMPGGDVGYAVTPDGSTAYTTTGGPDNGAGSIMAIDLATGRPAKTIAVPEGAYDIAISPDGKTAYATTVDGITVIDLIKGRIGASVDTPDGSGYIALSPDGSIAYVVTGDVTGAAQNSFITPINLARHTTGNPISIPAPAGAGGIAVAPDGKTAYVTIPSGAEDPEGTLIAVNLANGTSGAPISIPMSIGANGIAITPDGSTAYVTNGSDITPIDLSSGRVGTSIKVPGTAYGIRIG